MIAPEPCTPRARTSRSRSSPPKAHSCSRSPPSPSGCSGVAFEALTNPSSDTLMSKITSVKSTSSGRSCITSAPAAVLFAPPASAKRTSAGADVMQDRPEEVDLTEVIFDMSVSLDGFVRASNATPEQPLGDGGERLHEWAFGGDERDREVLARGVQGSGAIIAGRRTYDDSVPISGAGGPHPPIRVFVVTHEAPDAVPKGGVYTFVTDGIESALEQAKASAGDKNVYVMGGPDTRRQFIEAGLLEEIGVHLVPVLFGSGTRMFEH